MRVRFVLFVLALYPLGYGTAAAGPEPIVAVEGGEIQGSLEADGKVAVFKGIPYAAPPVGDLRWRSPQPVEPWEAPATQIDSNRSAPRVMMMTTTSSGG